MIANTDNRRATVRCASFGKLGQKSVSLGLNSSLQQFPSTLCVRGPSTGLRPRLDHLRQCHRRHHHAVLGITFRQMMRPGQPVCRSLNRRLKLSWAHYWLCTPMRRRRRAMRGLFGTATCTNTRFTHSSMVRLKPFCENLNRGVPLAFCL